MTRADNFSDREEIKYRLKLGKSLYTYENKLSSLIFTATLSKKNSFSKE